MAAYPFCSHCIVYVVPFILLSDAMLLIFLYVFYSLGQIYGAWNLFVFWGIPYLATNFL